MLRSAPGWPDTCGAPLGCVPPPIRSPEGFSPQTAAYPVLDSTHPFSPPRASKPPQGAVRGSWLCTALPTAPVPKLLFCSALPPRRVTNGRTAAKLQILPFKADLPPVPAWTEGCRATPRGSFCLPGPHGDLRTVPDLLRPPSGQLCSQPAAQSRALRHLRSTGDVLAVQVPAKPSGNPPPGVWFKATNISAGMLPSRWSPPSLPAHPQGAAWQPPAGKAAGRTAPCTPKDGPHQPRPRCQEQRKLQTARYYSDTWCQGIPPPIPSGRKSKACGNKE